MHTQIRRLTIFSAVALAALLTVGSAVANAHGGPGVRGASTGALVTRAAKELDVTRAKLKSAIVESAVATINAAAEDEDIDADEAAELKEEAQDNLRVAYHLSKTRTVASNLGVTTAKLNVSFRAARKTLALARINRAVENGDLTAEEAAELTQELNQASLPGYKAAGRGFGRHGGHAR
jgi:DNA-binding transcriptional regulator YdaS (Cro superfamily)